MRGPNMLSVVLKNHAKTSYTINVHFYDRYDTCDIADGSA